MEAQNYIIEQPKSFECRLVEPENALFPASKEFKSDAFKWAEKVENCCNKILGKESEKKLPLHKIVSISLKNGIKPKYIINLLGRNG